MKKLFSGLLTILPTFVATFALVGSLNAGPYDQDTDTDTSARTTTNSDKTVVQIAQDNPQFSTLVKALVAADLVSTLQGTGPFTILAPTNDAFDKLPPGVLQDLLKPENKAKLVDILTYHVIPGKVMAADVKTMKAKTVNGKDLDVKVQGSNVMVNNAKVTKTDIVGSNGVIHVIDTVLMP